MKSKLLRLILACGLILSVVTYCPASPPYPEQHQVIVEIMPVMQEPSRGTERFMLMEATAYSYTGSRTFTGTWPRVGTIAVDPVVIPLGSEVWVDGYGWGRAEDIGGLIRGNIIDLYMDTEQEALEWGRRWVKVIMKNTL